MTPRVLTREHSSDATDMHLLIGNDSRYSVWSPVRIKEALQREDGLDPASAEDITNSVSTTVLQMGKELISTSLIRELVNLELINKGYRTNCNTVMLPKHDVSLLMHQASLENSNVTALNPESVAFTISEIVMKKMALEEYFGSSSDVTKSHLSGAIHVHDLGMFNRVYCSVHSVDYIKRYGLNIPELDIVSAPAKHLGTLIGHINTYLSVMQAYYAGAMGLGYLNISMAPYVRGMGNTELRQHMQYLMFSLSQCAYSRGAQVMFSDFNLHASIPDWVCSIPAIGPGGVETGKTYGEYEREARRITNCLLNIGYEGDATGAPFAFPKLNLHIDHKGLSSKPSKSVIYNACEVASKNGGVYFIMDYSDVSLAACCRLRTEVDTDMMNNLTGIRFCGLQNVTINLPQIAYRVGDGDFDKTVEEVGRMMDIAFKAHIIKRKHIKEFMRPGNCLHSIGRIASDGKPFVDMSKVTHIVGLIGLDSMLLRMYGKHIHEDNGVLMKGLQIVAAMNKKCEEYTEQTGLKFVLEESPAESASQRLARIDVERFDEAEDFVLGTKDAPYYPNSVHIVPDAQIGFLDRLRIQSMFHPLIKAGAIVHAFVGEHLPKPKAILSLVENTHKKGQCSQLTISPEFTVCTACNRTTIGLKESCPHCGNTNVKQRTRIVGYYSDISRWNPSKKSELKDRQKGNYE